jgi:hypothetical protein
VRKRFEDNQVAMLEGMQWWHWPEERIRASIDVLMSLDVHRLYASWKEASKRHDCASTGEWNSNHREGYYFPMCHADPTG